MAAAKAMLDEHHNPLPQNPRDYNTYTLGRIGRHNVVLACLPTGVMGTLSAARVAIYMLQAFKEIRIGLMVGIGGGVPSEENDIRLGDVVVSQPTRQSGGVIQYDFGKTVQEGRFEQIGSLNRPPDVLLTALANLQSEHMIGGPKLANYLSEILKRYPRATGFARPNIQDLLYDAEYDHIMGCATCSQCDTGRLIDRELRHSEDPFIHYGLIASGNQVMKHGATREQLRKELNVLCFEMEAAGLMDEFPCLVVRGICDYADSHKNKRWQGYAAATAAAFAKELLSVIPGNLVVGTRSAVETTETSYQSSEFEEESTIKVPKNSVSQINDQAIDIVQLTSSQDLNNSSTNRKALPLRPQDGKEQVGSQIALHPDIASERDIKDAQATQLLLENGFDIYAANFEANMALLWAASRDHEGDMVQLLLRKGADVNTKGGDLRMALHFAARKGHEAVVQLLLEKGADVYAKASGGWTALHFAARKGHEAVVLLLLEKGADVDAKAGDGATALHLAAKNGHEAVVRLLLEKGADVNAKAGDRRRTALHVAAQNGHEAVVRLLLEKGADVNAKGSDGATALHVAAQNGHEAVVRLLLEKGADVNAKASDGATALHLAAKNGHEAVVRLLLEKGADVNAKANDGATALHLAAKNGHEAVVRLLLEKGADVNAKAGDRRRMALHVAAQNGHEAVVRLLLEKGADVNAKGSDGATALHFAAQNGHGAVVRLLLEKGADVNAKAGDRRTALHFAAWEGHLAVVRLLLKKGADVNAKDGDRRTALRVAAQNGHLAVVRLLLEKGADVNAKDGDRRTALRVAAQNGHEAVVRLLKMATKSR